MSSHPQQEQVISHIVSEDFPFPRSRDLAILGDDTITGRRLMEMIQPEACMDKPEAVDCAAVEAVSWLSELGGIMDFSTVMIPVLNGPWAVS